MISTKNLKKLNHQNSNSFDYCPLHDTSSTNSLVFSIISRFLKMSDKVQSVDKENQNPNAMEIDEKKLLTVESE